MAYNPQYGGFQKSIKKLRRIMKSIGRKADIKLVCKNGTVVRVSPLKVKFQPSRQCVGARICFCMHFMYNTTSRLNLLLSPTTIKDPIEMREQRTGDSQSMKASLLYISRNPSEACCHNLQELAKDLS